jgi:glycosyltransferase involved in cell wall biosynthesis
MANIGFISCTKGIPWAATDDVMLRCAKVALQRGHSVAASINRSLADSPKMVSFRDSGGRSFVRHPFRPTRLHFLKQRFISDFRSFLRFSPDVVVFNAGSILDQFHQPDLLYFLETYGGPIVYYCHGHSELYDLAQQRGRLWQFLQRMAGFIFVADENRATIESQLPGAIENCHVVPNAPTFRVPTPLPMPPGNLIRFATVSRLESFWKGHRTILRVLGEEQWKNREWRLDIYGTGPDESYIRELAVHLGIEHRVQFHGHVDDICEVWKHCHLLLHASWAESLSLAVLEAMMAGRPVVCADSGDIRRFVAKDAGFVSDAATPYSFGKVMEEAWQKRDLWSAIGANGHAIATELLDNDPAAKVVSILECIMAHNG